LIEALRAVVPETGGVLVEASDRQPYETGWRYGRGVARAVVRPQTTEQVADVLRLCHERGVRVHAIGGNTGLVGASNPDATGEQVVVALERLRRTIDIDPVDRTVLVDGGVLLSQLNAALAEHGLVFPIDLGADPQIGGMVVTNTGGTSLLKYGDVRHNLLGLEVVLADGTVVSQLSPLRKNNTGLDLKQVFVGTSGALGVVTRAVLQVVPLPRQRATALVAAADGAAVLALLQGLERSVGSALTVFEAIHGEAYRATLRHGANLQDPFRGAVPTYTVLVELTSTLDAAQLDLEELLQNALVAHVEAGAEGIDDVLMDPKGLGWALRHQISESLRHEGTVLGLDLSVPRSRLAAFSAAARDLVQARFPFATVCDFGHWGDGGTHLNVVWREADVPEGFHDGGPEGLKHAMQDALCELCVAQFGGSFSAEHGVGPHNQRFYDRYVDGPTQRVMAALRAALDPTGAWK